MDTEEQPGIRFLGTHLKGLDFLVSGSAPKPIRTALRLSIARDLSLDKSSLQVRIDGDLFGNLSPEERPPIVFTFSIVGRFAVTEHPNLSLDEFATDQAPAHLVPYIRELISNVTARSPLPTLNIGPVNVKALVESGKASFEFTESAKDEQQA